MSDEPQPPMGVQIVLTADAEVIRGESAEPDGDACDEQEEQQ